MTDWAEGIETRNYGIRSEIDAGMLSELMRTIVALMIVAAALLFYSWVRSQIVSTGYESQHLFTMEESLLRTQKRLILEQEMLSNPERIDVIARIDLAMTPLRPNQLILPRTEDIERTANTMAMAEPEALASASVTSPSN